MDERQLTFFSKLQCTDNYVLRTLARLPMVKYEMLALAAKYSLNGVYCAVSTIKDLVWLSLHRKFNFRPVLVFVFYCVIVLFLFF